VDAAVLADQTLRNQILSLDEDTGLADETGFIAGIFTTDNDVFDAAAALKHFKTIQGLTGVRRLQYPWQIFQWNDALIREDFGLVKAAKIPQVLPQGSQYLNTNDIFIEEGAKVSFATINASTGPVYIGRNALVMEGATIRGPFALCEGAVLKMGARVYGATTLGPYCTGGGEIKNSIMQAFSNKGHDGYLGDSVVGLWCNLGAGTTNSNVKNTGGEVKMWNYPAQDYLPVGQKGGVIMGDYTRTAINTKLNTGTVVGVCCNLVDGGLLPKYIPNFTWGGAGDRTYVLEKALRHVANWKKMKGHTMSVAETGVLEHIFGRL
jgi:UDP-N-acetylglucosamine diphosphorylase/glucosamine-1-phosphate N-acetyltransferase